MNILEEIGEKTKERIRKEKKQCSLEEMRNRAEQKTENKEKTGFLQALKAQGMSYICEVKKASPRYGCTGDRRNWRRRRQLL